MEDVELGILGTEEFRPYMGLVKHHGQQQMFAIYHFPLFLTAMADCPSSIQLLCDHGAR